jgi:drug/metabolite transporter (DMT)-like permease
MHNPAALLALGAGACSAMALVSVNQLAPTDSSQAILFYYFLISTIAAAPFAAMHWCVPTQTEWWLLGGVGVGMALAQLFIIMAYRHASAAQLAPFNYSVVVFSGVIGWIVWHEALDMTALLGILLVCAGGIASIRAAPHIHGPSAMRSTTALSRRDHAS